MTDHLSDPRLHALFEDLVDEESAFVIADPRAARVAGNRRRRRRRVAAAVIAAAAVVLLGGALAAVHRQNIAPAGGAEVAAHQYPRRIDVPLFGTGSLPRSPGPVAGVVERVAEHETSDEAIGWYVVGQSGQLWSITPGQVDLAAPALSADGTHIGYLTDHGSYVTRDLVTGAEVVFPQLGGEDGESAGDAYVVSVQTPSSWSPDDEHVLMIGNRHDAGIDVGALVLSADGTIAHVLPATHSAAWPIGWLDSSHLAWLVDRDHVVSLMVTDLAGDHPELTRLRRLPRGRTSQWSGAVSPDGATVAISQLGSRDDPRVELFSTSTGEQVDSLDEGRDLYDVCALVWQGDRPALPTLDTSGSEVLVDADLAPLVLADPRLATRCSVWSSTALDGSSHGGLGAHLFGDSTSTAAWHWREWVRDAVTALVLVVVLLLLVIRGAGVVRHRRRRLAGPS